MTFNDEKMKIEYLKYFDIFKSKKYESTKEL